MKFALKDKAKGFSRFPVGKLFIISFHFFQKLDLSVLVDFKKISPDSRRVNFEVLKLSSLMHGLL